MTEKGLKYQIFSDYGSNEIMNQENVSISFVIESIKKLDWNKFHQVILSKNENDWIEVGGNLTDDGLACIYEENNERFVIDNAPLTIEQMINILISYYKGDEEFKKENKFTGEKESKEKTEKEKESFIEWKQKFDIQQKKEKTETVKRATIVLIFVAIISTIFYLWFIDELKFIGQETENTQAKIVKTRMRHIGRGYYLQVATYEFEFKNNIYSGTFSSGKRVGKQEVGNLIKVKFSTSNPNRSKLIGIYKNN